MDQLWLDITEFADIDHWRWRLTDPHGSFKADHQVALNRADQEYEGFRNLYRFLRRKAESDRRLESEADLVDQVGQWIGEKVLGQVGDKIVACAPVAVRVRLPARAEGLLYCPLELSYVRGRPLAVQDVSLIFELVEHPSGGRKIAAREKLRMLAIFSLPTDASALGLRRERYALKHLIRRIAQTQGKAIELRILQYGVTRDRLWETLEEGEGWDLIHFSGHGLPAGLLLENRDGTRDLISTRDLEELLCLARPRLKLVTLSACESAAAISQETLRWLNRDMPRREEEERAAPAEPLPALARAFIERLDCAVLAMRYRVGDEFAIRLTENLYEGLLERRRSLPAALQLAMRNSLPRRLHPDIPPISVATPALFGARAADLYLIPLDQPPTPQVPRTGLAYFPRAIGEEPARFVGRVGPLARASMAIAPESGKTGILFHGMAGAGKTACALELSYRYETGRFGYFACYRAPAEGADIEGALAQLAQTLEAQFHNQQLDFPISHVVDRVDELAAFLPRLTKLMEDYAILIVLDNLESLLTPSGEWRDERWSMVVDALLAHNGLSRTVFTSRRLPATLAANERVLVEPTHVLSLSEAVLLARELPNLGRLLRGENEQVTLERGRELVNRTLAVVQGHPKLLELAEGQAADPEALAVHLERVAEAWGGGTGRLEAFFQQGESQLEAEDFLEALVGWTQGISAALPPASRTLFHFLCCLEEGDRLSSVVKGNWAQLWRRLERPGEAPDLAATLAPLTAQALVEARPWEATEVLHTVHAGVADAGRAEAGDTFQGAVDAVLAAFWTTEYRRGLQEEIQIKSQGAMQGGSQRVIQAGLSAAPYLLRQQRWSEASGLLEEAILRDRSPTTLNAILLLLRRIAAATRGTERELIDAGVLANALLNVGRRREAEVMLRDILRRAVDREEFRTASGITTDLIALLREAGQLQEALALAERQKDYTRLADLGPWTQLGDEAGRLGLLYALGRYDQVLSEVESLREQMRVLPQQSGQAEAAIPWNVLETILEIGRNAAARLGRWERALELNGEVVANKKARGAPALEMARTRFNDYNALLALGYYAKARALLEDCRDVFDQEGEAEELGMVFSALASLEGRLGHHGQSVSFEKTALRYRYRAGAPENCAISHSNLANHLMRAGDQPEAALAHRLAAGVLRFQMGSGMLDSTLGYLKSHFAAFAPAPPPLPASFDELCRLVEAVQGVRFRELFECLPRRAASGDEALAEIIQRARAS